MTIEEIKKIIFSMNAFTVHLNCIYKGNEIKGTRREVGEEIVDIL